MSYANCGLPYYVGGVIKERDALLISGPEKFRDWFDVEVRTGSEVVAIDRARRGRGARGGATGEPVLVPLAGPANRQGRLAADAIAGRPVRFRGVQGTAVVQVFDLTAALTGASERALARDGIAYEKAYLYASSHATYYPGARPLLLKLLFAPGGRVLGAQAVGEDGVARRIDVLATAIQLGGTVYDLEQAELAYAPQHGSAKDPVNVLGFIAANHLRGDAPLVHWDRWASGAALVVDVRTPDERSASAPVPGSVHVPLAELRRRHAELPRDRPLWVHCGVGQRSHVAVRFLRQQGFDAYNVSGGYRLWQVVRGLTEPASPAATAARR